MCPGLLRAPPFPAQGMAALGISMHLGRPCPPLHPPRLCAHPKPSAAGVLGVSFFPFLPVGACAWLGGACVLFGGAERCLCTHLIGGWGTFSTCLCRWGTACTSPHSILGCPVHGPRHFCPVARTHGLLFTQTLCLFGPEQVAGLRRPPARTAGQGWRLPGFRGDIKVSSVTFQPLPSALALASRESFRHLLSNTCFTCVYSTRCRPARAPAHCFASDSEGLIKTKEIKKFLEDSFTVLISNEL